MSEYTALYRRFRPDSFDNVIGQEHVTTTLTNQVKSGKLSHAYLFCGTRGTGKTTCAKILARAINCEHPRNGSPCNECATCRLLAAGGSVDINEIDAASNNGVDEIREIKENVRYTPTVGRYKVYIIDEVHMLSQAAFNALLKTLEEPPAHAVFILATTEAHKLPATILSRCMRFDFKLVPDVKLIELLRKILTEIGVAWEEDALKLIARAGEGSVRDTLTIADTCVSYCGELVTYEKAAEVIGTTDRGVVVDFAAAMLAGDVGKVFEISSDLFARGRAVAAFNRDVISVLRDFCVVLTTKNAFDLLVYPEPVFRGMEECARRFRVEHILECIDILASAENEIKFSLHPRILFEAAALRCCKCAGVSLESVLARVARLEEALSAGAALPPRPAPIENAVPSGIPSRPAPIENAAPSARPSRPAPIENVAPSGMPARPAPVEPAAPTGVTMPSNRLWGTVIRTLRERQNGLLYTICQEASCDAEGGVLTVYTSERGAAILERPNNRKVLEEILRPLGVAQLQFSSGEKKVRSESEEMKEFKSLLGDKWIEK